MRFSVASGTDNSLLQLIANDTEPYGIGGLVPIQREYISAGLAGPVVSANVLTYTVPADKIARLDYVGLSLIRFAASAGVGLSLIDCGIIPSGGSRIALAAALMHANLVGEKDTIFISPKLILEAGDEIQVDRETAPSGGFVFFRAQLFLSELDV